MDTETFPSQSGFKPLVIDAKTFEKLYNLEIKEFVETKGGSGGFKASYISWPFACLLLKQSLPEVFVDFERTDSGSILFTHGDPDRFTGEVRPYLTDGTQRTPSISFPIMDNRFGAIELPDSRAISDATWRGAVKAIAVFTGLGLRLYSGEDIPQGDKPFVNSKGEEMTPPDKAEKAEANGRKGSWKETPEDDRIYLNVPFKEKDEAKQAGARFNSENKKWYATKDTIGGLQKWAGDWSDGEEIESPKEDKPTDPDLEEDVPF